MAKTVDPNKMGRRQLGASAMLAGGLSRGDDEPAAPPPARNLSVAPEPVIDLTDEPAAPPPDIIDDVAEEPEPVTTPPTHAAAPVEPAPAQAPAAAPTPPPARSRKHSSPARPAQVKLDGPIDDYLASIEMEGVRYRNKVAVNRSAAVNYALRKVMTEMKPAELARVLLAEANAEQS